MIDPRMYSDHFWIHADIGVRVLLLRHAAVHEQTLHVHCRPGDGAWGQSTEPAFLCALWKTHTKFLSAPGTSAHDMQTIARTTSEQAPKHNSVCSMYCVLVALPILQTYRVASILGLQCIALILYAAKVTVLENNTHVVVPWSHVSN